jgi:L-threonylcarbamoyladenylate synthase
MAPSRKTLACDVSSISFDAATGLPTITDSTTLRNLETAAKHLRENSLVAFPTETVYGLGGSALAESTAVSKIYKAKGRPSDNPLIVHIAHQHQLDGLIDPSSRGKLPRYYPALMQQFWPGPLTLLFPTLPGESLSKQVTCGLTTVGIRIPSHPVARALLSLSGVPVSAPSANTSGRPSPTAAHHVALDLEDKEELACILDGGNCEVGLESTVVTALPEGRLDRSGKEFLRILRLGGVSPEDLQQCIDDAGLAQEVTIEFDDPQKTSTNGTDPDGHDFIPTTPGMKYKHYSPDAKVVLVQPSVASGSARLGDLLERHTGKTVGLLHLEGSELYHALHAKRSDLQCVSLGQACDYQSQARRLFSGLRDLDERGVNLIIVEAVKEEKLGRTVMERLRKSAGGSDPIQVQLL